MQEWVAAKDEFEQLRAIGKISKSFQRFLWASIFQLVRSL